MRPEEKKRKGFKFVTKAPVTLTEGIVSFEDLDEEFSPKKKAANKTAYPGSMVKSVAATTAQKTTTEKETPKQSAKKPKQEFIQHGDAHFSKKRKHPENDSEAPNTSSAPKTVEKRDSPKSISTKGQTSNSDNKRDVVTLTGKPSSSLKGKKNRPDAVSDIAEISGGKTKSNAQKGKAHYPRILYETNVAVTTSASGRRVSSSGAKATARSHRDILRDLVSDVCRVEAEGLRDYAAGDVERKALLESLQTVLAQLPDAVSSTLKSEDRDDFELLPELSSAEKLQLDKLRTVAEALREQSKALSKYEEDIKSLAHEHDIWLDGAPEEDVANARKKSKKSATSSGVASTAKEFASVLDELEGTCNSMLSYAEKASSAMTKAKDAQEALYNTYQAVRMGSVSSAPTTEPKELLKGLLRGL